MRIADIDIQKHNWQTFERCRECGMYHMEVEIHVGKDGVYAETKDLA